VLIIKAYVTAELKVKICAIEFQRQRELLVISVLPHHWWIGLLAAMSAWLATNFSPNSVK
jgi:hypothetical protein